MAGERAEFAASFVGTVLSAGDVGTEARLRYTCVAGDSWVQVAGRSSAISHRSVGDGRRPLVFDLPIDITYKSHIAFGWPQIIISIHGTDCRGMEALLGYGRVHFPTVHGERKIRVPLFAPRPVSIFASLLSVITGKTPELTDPNSLADGSDTYSLRTTSCGYVDLSVSLITKGFHEMDYDNVPRNATQTITE